MELLPVLFLAKHPECLLSGKSAMFLQNRSSCCIDFLRQNIHGGGGGGGTRRGGLVLKAKTKIKVAYYYPNSLKLKILNCPIKL